MKKASSLRRVSADLATEVETIFRNLKNETLKTHLAEVIDKVIQEHLNTVTKSNPNYFKSKKINQILGDIKEEIGQYSWDTLNGILRDNQLQSLETLVQNTLNEYMTTYAKQTTQTQQVTPTTEFAKEFYRLISQDIENIDFDRIESLFTERINKSITDKPQLLNSKLGEQQVLKAIKSELGNIWDSANTILKELGIKEGIKSLVDSIWQELKSEGNKDTSYLKPLVNYFYKVFNQFYLNEVAQILLRAGSVAFMDKKNYKNNQKDPTGNNSGWGKLLPLSIATDIGPISSYPDYNTFQNKIRSNLPTLGNDPFFVANFSLDSIQKSLQKVAPIPEFANLNNEGLKSFVNILTTDRGIPSNIQKAFSVLKSVI